MAFILALLALFLTAQPAVAMSASSDAMAVTSAKLSEPNTNPYLNDKRGIILYSFLGNYNSPLKGYTADFIKSADKYNLDWRLLVAISGVESTFASQLPYNSYNAWGWGIYGENMLYFKSYPEAIETISKSLRENYLDKWGAQNVYQIGRFYAASPTWAQRVVYFMDKIDSRQELPITL